MTKFIMTMDNNQLEELLKWIDSIPLSRKKKNIIRDFSDGVLMAEICAHFYPKHVDLFNYNEGLKVDTKIYNWNTLNAKVLQKIKFPIDKATITDIANCKQGTIEKVLWDFKQFVETKQEEEQKPYFNEIQTDPDIEEIENALKATDRSLLEKKIQECENQAKYIEELNAKIKKVEDLIKEKDLMISEFHSSGYRH